MTIIHVVATDHHNGIGFQGKLPWSCPEDMKFFREFTQGKTLVVGRKTYNDIVRRYEKKNMSRISPLPGRKLKVLTTDLDFETAYADVEIVRSINDIKALSETMDLYVIGGEQIYAQLLPDYYVMTNIHGVHEVDVSYPIRSFHDSLDCHLDGTAGVSTRQVNQSNSKKFSELFSDVQRAVNIVNSK